MSPVLRVDDEVWEWLKSKARPLEDTPNSVMRRIAGIDPPLVGVESARRPAAAGPITAPRGDDSDEEIETVPSPTVAEPGQKRITGEWLNRAFRLDARHALYHKDGTFYERLTRFPGVLCDRNGSVRFEDEAEFLADSNLSVGEKVNLPQGLQSHPRYQRFPLTATKR